ncbi:hypothetical protein DSO57_1003015 [Entomophthora muscae]|uniref:Uncharacterized protein n=1 Tax=Entomophthora muscae TaxID=34485 RepID=A0ACC2SXM0_9FUNG|nr:hypothetical protein DSO57_1003015 [Entomophthora muscae]
MLCTWCNSDKVPMDYPNLLSKFGVCHHKETMFSFVQAMHSNEDAMSPIRAGQLYHSQYDASCLAAEVRLGLQSASLAPGQISAQHAHTIVVVNCAINAILIWPSNNDSCKDLAGFAFKFGNPLPSANRSGSISTHSGL